MTDNKLLAPASNACRRQSRRLADAYLVAADAPATVRAYTADWKHFSGWCLERAIQAIPAKSALVGEYLAELGEGTGSDAVGADLATWAARRFRDHVLSQRRAG